MRLKLLVVMCGLAMTGGAIAADIQTTGIDEEIKRLDRKIADDFSRANAAKDKVLGALVAATNGHPEKIESLASADVTLVRNFENEKARSAELKRMRTQVQAEGAITGIVHLQDRGHAAGRKWT